MRSPRTFARRLPACCCVPSIPFVCSLHRGDPQAQSIEDADALDDECPRDPDTLPERLRGYGHRGADQDGYDGSEWVTPQQDMEAQMIEAARVLLDAEFIPMPC